MHRYQELLDLLKSFEADFTKFYVKGNKSAGTRLRKHMKSLQDKAKEIRAEIQAIKKSEDGEE